LKLGKTVFRNFETGLPASPGKVRLRISARGTSKELLEMAIEEYVVSLNLIINDISLLVTKKRRRSSFWDMLKRKNPFYSRELHGR
jgi:hypothetical protein